MEARYVSDQFDGSLMILCC